MSRKPVLTPEPHTRVPHCWDLLLGTNQGLSYMRSVPWRDRPPPKKRALCGVTLREAVSADPAMTLHRCLGLGPRAGEDLSSDLKAQENKG